MWLDQGKNCQNRKCDAGVRGIVKGLSSSIKKYLRDARFKYVTLPIIRLAYKFRYWVQKRIHKTHLDLFYLLRQQIRTHIPEAKSEGYNDHQDMVINVTAWKLHRPGLFEDTIPEIYFDGLEDENFSNLREELTRTLNTIRDMYSSAVNEINILAEQVSSDKGIQKTTMQLCLIDVLLNNATNKNRLAEHYLERAKEIDPEVKPLKYNELEKIRKEARKETRRLRNIIADKEAVKLTINPTAISTAVVLASSLFLISGYLYDKYYLGAFGIDVSKYFVLSDYLASSIEGLRYAAVAAISGLIWMYLGVHQASRKSYAQIEYERSIKDYTPALFVIIAILNLVMGYVFGGKDFYHGVLFSTIILSYFGIGMIAHKLFKEPVPAIFIMAFITIFFSYLYYSAATTVYDIRHGTIRDLKKWEFTFSDKVNHPQDNLVLLAGNSGFFLFWDINEKVSMIIPRGEVIKIISRK